MVLTYGMQALDELEPMIGGTILIVTTGRSLIRLGYVEALKRHLEKYQKVKNVTVFDRVTDTVFYLLFIIRKNRRLTKFTSCTSCCGPHGDELCQYDHGD